ncbi:hypothetical protein BDN67DRAFT_1003366 [Paxillus ammoniavirescens]|nr:hypothetical protein BDN67DRAFT_1003366 [Paxillus ammoniavirescens]
MRDAGCHRTLSYMLDRRYQTFVSGIPFPGVRGLPWMWAASGYLEMDPELEGIGKRQYIGDLPNAQAIEPTTNDHSIFIQQCRTFRRQGRIVDTSEKHSLTSCSSQEKVSPSRAKNEKQKTKTKTNILITGTKRRFTAIVVAPDIKKRSSKVFSSRLRLGYEEEKPLLAIDKFRPEDTYVSDK